MDGELDVLVLGSGNAGLSAALAASEAGATVGVFERAPRALAGGNSFFTAGAFRVTYDGIHELIEIVEPPAPELAQRIDLQPYRVEDFVRDLERVTLRRTDPDLAQTLAAESLDGVRWLVGHGVRFELLFRRQSFEVDGRVRFWGNLTVGATGGGQGLVAGELAAVERRGIAVQYERRGVALHLEEGHVAGVVVETPTGEREVIRARAVVLAAGGFEADARLRAMYLGPGWDLAKVRGTPYNTGDGILMALAIGAEPHGHWSGCHAIAWDAAAPQFGDATLTNRYSRQAYPYGLVVNQQGRRFIDEGADFRNYTYAKYGAQILRQPSAIAYQLFDARTVEYVDQVDYETAQASRFTADTVAALASQLDIDPSSLEATVSDFNRAVQDGAFDPTQRDGKGTRGINPPKSNWALPLAEPPFVAFAVTCGITFTFGGLRTDLDGNVLRAVRRPIPGLFACGELLGGLFYHNYPGGSGLAAGTVFGRRAGAAAARSAQVPAGARA